MHKMNYDLICVGGGIANLALAYTYKKENIQKTVAIIEKGNKIANRICPKTKTGYCLNCKPCRITTGFGGAGCFSDCKLTYSEEVGGSLINYVGKEKFNELQNSARNFFSDLGASTPSYFNEKYFERFSKQCEDSSLHLVKSEVQHLGTEGSYELMLELYARLEQMGVDIICNTAVTEIDFKRHNIFVNNEVGLTNHYHYEKVSIAVGRYGSEWLSNICKKNDIELEENTVDIGVRVEVPKYVLEPVASNLYEMKIVNQISDHSSVRTFCVNPGGFVVQENYDEVQCVNGHSFFNTKSDNSNFALLYSIRFTEPFNDPIEYGKSICKLANMLGGGHILVQRLGDLINNKRTNSKRLAENKVVPTLKDAIGGDLRFVLPSKAVDAIIDTLRKLDKVMPEIWDSDTLIYAPEVKFYSSKIKLNDKLQVKNKGMEDVYFLGDSSGVTHGIIQSCMSGIYTAENISKSNGKEEGYPFDIK